MAELDECHLKWPCVPTLHKYKGGAFYYKRECYGEFYTLLEGLVMAKAKVVTLTGTLGIGKSVFYGYFFDRFRHEHADVCVIAVAFDARKPGDVMIHKGDKSKPVYHKTADSVVAAAIMREAAVEAFAAARHVVYLCDGPPDEFRSNSCVVFTSPREDLLRDTEKKLHTYYMPLWTREELHEAARVLELPIRSPLEELSGMDIEQDDDVTTRERKREAEIDRRFDIFGGTARFCLIPDPVEVPRALSKLDRAIRSIRDLTKLQMLLEGNEPESVRHRLLHIEPEKDRAIMTTKLASPYVVEKLADNMLASYVSNREHFRNTLHNIPEAASLCGRLFERETHDKLVEGCTLALRRLTSAGAAAANADPTVEKVVITPTIEPIVKFRAVKRAMLAGGPYHQPESNVWESIDSFYLTKMTTESPITKELVVQWNTDPMNRLILFQITISKSHDVNVAGVVHVLTKLGLLESVATSPERAALVFVVPKEKVRGYKRQNIVSPAPNGSSLITALDDIADKTATTLGDYEIRTVDELQAKIVSFDNKSFSVKPEHAAAWARARRAGIKHGLLSEGTQFRDAIARIPQYVCSWEDSA